MAVNLSQLDCHLSQTAVAVWSLLCLVSHAAAEIQDFPGAIKFLLWLRL